MIIIFSIFSFSFIFLFYNLMFFVYYYLFLGILGLFLGFSFSLYMRLELVLPFSVFNDDILFNTSVTSHGILMVFYGLTPLGVSLFYYLFYRSFSFYLFSYIDFINVFLYFLSFLLLFISTLLGDLNLGWTLYPPLSSFNFNPHVSVDLAIFSIIIVSVSSLLGSYKGVLVILEILSIYGFYVSSFLWSFFVLYLLVLLSFPVFIICLLLLFLDRTSYFYYFNPSLGGDTLLYQSLFWFFGHPEVYILILPIFGYISFFSSYYSFSNFCYGSLSMVFSLFSIFLLGSVVYGHHMFVVGLSVDFKSYFMSASMVISIPTGVKIFNWLTSFYSRRVFSFMLVQFWSFSFLLVFCLGGLSGLILGNGFLDMVLHDSYFVVGHFHLVLSVACFCGFVSYFYLLILNSFHRVLELFIFYDYIIFSLSFFSVVFLTLVFIIFHILGIFGFPRRISCYPDRFISLFFYSSLFYFLGSFSLFTLFYFTLFIIIKVL